MSQVPHTPIKHTIVYTPNSTSISQKIFDDLTKEYNAFFLDARIWMVTAWISVTIAIIMVICFLIYLIYVYTARSSNSLNIVISALQVALNIVAGVVVKLIFSQKEAAIDHLKSCSERRERQRTSYSHWQNGNAMIETVRTSGLSRKAQDDLIEEIIKSLLVMQHDD